MRVLLSFPVSTIIILHHSEEKETNAGPGVAAVLLCSLHVIILTGFDSSGFRLCGRGRGAGLFLDMAEPEMSLFGSSSAQTCLDWHVALLTQALVFLQGSGHLFPVQFSFGGVLRANGRPGVVLTAEPADTFLTGDSKGQEVISCHWPGALWFVSGHQFAFQSCRGRFGLRAHVLDGFVLVLTPASLLSMGLLTAAQH